MAVLKGDMARPMRRVLLGRFKI